MTFTIGRASLAYGPYNISHSGDRIRFNLDIDQDTTTDPDVARVIRQQLLGMDANRDEPVVPVTWTDDPDFDGFYRVDSVNVDPSTVYLTNGFMRCAVSMTKVGGGYATARHEITAIGDSLSTAVSAVTPDRSVWFQDDAYDGYAGTTRTSDTGDVRESNTLAAATLTAIGYSLPAASAYDGAVTVEMSVGGTWYPVTGRQLPSVSDPSNIRITNGLVRISWGSSGATLEYYDASSWSTVGVFDLTTGASGSTITPSQHVAILRNAPNFVSVSFGVESDDNPAVLSLARGQLFVVAYLGALKTGAAVTPTEAATTTTGGLYATNANASGHRWVLASPAAFSTDTSNGSLTNTAAADGTPLMLGVDPSGVTDTPATVISSFWGAVSHRQDVIAR